MAGRIQGSLVGMLIVACIGFCACLQAQEVHVSSRITQVTLFQQQAEVTRLAKAQIGAGRSSVIFDDVPQSLNADSLKVNGSGSAAVAIEGVEYKTVYLSAEFSKEAQVLDDKIGVLNAEALLVSRSKERIESQRKSLQSLELDRNVPDGGDKAVRPRSAKEMAEVLSFVSDSSSRLDTELRAVEERAESLAKQLTALQQERSKYQPSRKSKSVVEVKLSSARETEVSLEVTYQTGSAGWSSTYNLMVSEAQADLELELQTYALISQRSGEDWLDVALTLSTARPQLGLNRPVPQPKVLDVYEPPPPVQALSRSLKANAAGARQQSFGMEEGVMMDMAAAPAPQLAMVETSSSVESSPGGVVSYKLPARISLRSDGSSEKVKVSSVSLTGSMLPSTLEQKYSNNTVKVLSRRSPELMPAVTEIKWAKADCGIFERRRE
jgi:uncharacterized protein (TIGR02231 family)